MIKAIVFDLDETLSDNDILTELSIEQSVKAMIDKGLNCTFEEGVVKLKEIIMTNPFCMKIEKLAEYFKCFDEEIIEAGIWTYSNADFEMMILRENALEVLKNLKDRFDLFLLTIGYSEQQNKKIDSLGIRNYFKKVFISNSNDKKIYLEKILNDDGLKSENVLVVGDRIDKEIKNANELGMVSIRLKKGKYSSWNPREDLEKADYEIENLKNILDIVGVEKKSEKEIFDKNNCKKNGLKIVAIGGGTGLPMVAEGLRKYTDDLSLVVTVTDSGRSSGILRREMNVLPPGDLRNCLIALSNSEKQMCDLFQYRFENGSLEGHNFGNLFIAALTKITGSFEKAVEEAGKILKLQGKVLPSTLDDVHVCVELEDGKIIEEENNIIDRDNFEVYLRSPIKNIFLKPLASSNPRVIKAIMEADIIVLCPGSLFTSVIPNLLVEGVSEAISQSNAKKIYVCNIMTQVSQTHNFTASKHVKKITKYLGSNLDYIILNNLKPDEKLIESYKHENAFLVENDLEVLRELEINVVEGDFLDDIEEKKLLWEKKDLLRHNPDKIAKAIMGLLEEFDKR